MQGIAKYSIYIIVTDTNISSLTQTIHSEICTSVVDDVVAEWLEPCFRHFAKAYLEIVQDQTESIRKDFFGLRDFYR